MKTKEVRGITIISLVVTIAVLLILAGVSISTLVGENGVIKNAKKIQNDTYYQIASEEVKQLVLEHKLRKEDETLEEFLVSKVPSRIDGVTRKDDNTLIVKKNGYEIEVESENRIIIFDATPYVGTYDGQPHDMLKSVNVSPSDAKIEYSIDNGKTYIENIPQITNASSVSVIVKASRIGYKTETVTKMAVVNKAEGTITLSATNGTIVYPNSTTFSASGNTGTLSVATNNNNIATASISGSTVTVKAGTTAGKAIITVTTEETINYTSKTATYEATIENGVISLSATPYTGTYDGQYHNAITSVTVNPSDAKLEYSLDGKNYVAEMPRIKDTSEFTVTVVASKEGYKTISTTETIKVNKAEGKLTLSSYNGNLTYPNSTSFAINENTTNVSITSSNTNIATASLNGNTVTVKSGTTAGKAIITVTTEETINYTSKTATYEATVNNGSIDLRVTPYTGNYDGKAHNAVTVTVSPSDAKLEYSTNNGASYSTTMPTITNASSFTVIVRASKTGYTTQSNTQTIRVNKANGSLSLSSYSGTIDYPNSTSFTASGTGSISAWSSNTGVATVSVSGNTIIVKSVGAGSATITVTSAASTNYNEKTATYTVTVKNPTFTEDSGVGYYADTDGDGTPDGIIFEDFKKGGSGTWGTSSYGSYTISTVSSTKSYYISQTNYKGPFGTKDVLTATGSGNARFYVMALSDYNNSATYTFTNAKGITSGEWSVPTRNELAAFGGELGITTSNYSGYGLKATYWSSSAHNFISGYYASFSAGEIIIVAFNSTTNYVRLARTF